ncbi:uncharacterized protein MYCFIDRAFT_173046 [Pseudocercospora fijiensis CIRAD86]|uniref:Uncharacterized protein n=1 Tax=Pseudocercospora fijiensis (strain CIRAD86) TaxID=383855 RepID=M3B3L5_PSEFD|nr:uncharacterized protein MYCFIDRAFT_173046 [Pseudocercospora fijiensis CIRAD86]EME83978.1 hypothetical protein MYCFIDRAFT_173046 [Pseudocercospora fijiensis CIRAD86]
MLHLSILHHSQVSITWISIFVKNKYLFFTLQLLTSASVVIARTPQRAKAILLIDLPEHLCTCLALVLIFLLMEPCEFPYSSLVKTWTEAEPRSQVTKRAAQAICRTKPSRMKRWSAARNTSALRLQVDGTGQHLVETLQDRTLESDVDHDRVQEELGRSMRWNGLSSTESTLEKERRLEAHGPPSTFTLPLSARKWSFASYSYTSNSTREYSAQIQHSFIVQPFIHSSTQIHSFEQRPITHFRSGPTDITTATRLPTHPSP